MARQQPFAYPPTGYKVGGSDTGGSGVNGDRRTAGCVSRPRWLQAVADAIFGDLRPAGAWDDEGALFGCPQSEGRHALQDVTWYGNLPDRDLAPMPEEVIKPIALLGYNPIPLETPVYFRGSLWQSDDGWERGT